MGGSKRNMHRVVKC